MGFTKLFITFLLVWVNSFDLICTSNFDFCTVTSHVIWMFAVLWERIGKCSSYTWLSKWASILLLQHVLLLSQLFEPGMLQGLTCCNTIIRVIHKQFLNQVLNICACMRNQFDYTCSFNCWEIELHMSCIFLKVF